MHGWWKTNVSLCLTAAEVREVTGYAWHARQCEALAAMGIRFTRQPQSGRPLVDRDEWARYTGNAIRHERPTPVPNWKALRIA